MSNIKTQNNSKELNECRIIEKFSSQKTVFKRQTYQFFLSQEAIVTAPVFMVIESELSIITKITTWWQNEFFHCREGLWDFLPETKPFPEYFGYIYKRRG